MACTTIRYLSPACPARAPADSGSPPLLDSAEVLADNSKNLRGRLLGHGQSAAKAAVNARRALGEGMSADDRAGPTRRRHTRALHVTRSSLAPDPQTRMTAVAAAKRDSGSLGGLYTSQRSTMSLARARRRPDRSCLRCPCCGLCGE